MIDPTGEGVERLLRETGRRPAPPAERTARVRETVRGHWRTERRRRLRRRALWLGVATAAAAAVVLAVVFVRPDAQIAARVERAEGSGSPGPPAAIQAGATLSTGADQRLACRLRSGHAVRLDRDTRVRFLSGRSVALEAGAVYVDSGGAAGAVEVETPFGRVRDVGTQFFLRLGEGSLRVGVREGSVVLGGSSAPVVVQARSVLRIDGLGHRVEPMPASGGAWAWAEAVAPPLAIEGRSARVFLEWVAREQGRSLRFDDPQVAAAASRTILQGSIEGMTPEQALVSVLPTCGLRHRVDGDVLHVGSVQ
jgi:ferric-dicitrate binding protein FerR (iron transport regulator)